MSRILETEVMLDLAEIQAYESFDRSKMIMQFTHTLLNKFPNINGNRIADVGCGTGDYFIGLCNALPNSTFVGYDASQPMLDIASTKIDTTKVTLKNKNINTDSFDGDKFDVIISSMFLHQLADPSNFWNLLKTIGNPGTSFMVWDLIRIEDDNISNNIVNHYVKDSTSPFQTSFTNSLKAAFLTDEIHTQLDRANIVATVENFSPDPEFEDLKVFIVYGTI